MIDTVKIGDSTIEIIECFEYCFIAQNVENHKIYILEYDQLYQQDINENIESNIISLEEYRKCREKRKAKKPQKNARNVVFA